MRVIWPKDGEGFKFIVGDTVHQISRYRYPATKKVRVRRFFWLWLYSW